MAGVSLMKSLQYPSSGPGRAQVANQGSSGALVTNEPAETAAFDPYIGKKVLTRWPEDNNFYEAVITDYNPTDVCGTFDCFSSSLLSRSSFHPRLFFVRADMLWFMTSIQKMRLGSGSISMK